MDNRKQGGLRGIITARQCPECGHHEVGFTTEDGIFHPLRPGTIIQTEDPSDTREIGDEGRRPVEMSRGPVPESRPRVPWVPDPLWGNSNLRVKFGVLLERADPVTPETYWKGYMEKLESLIAKERETPIPVILDRVFAAPHLAAGEPGEIAEKLWEDLEEIRKPVRQVSNWLERGDEESLKRMIHPLPAKGLEHGDADRDLLKRELEALALEEFLEKL